MLLLETDRYNAVACDLLVFPNSNGEILEDFDDQYKAYVKKHFVYDGITPEILALLQTEFVACYISGTELHPFWLYHSINSMTNRGASAYIQSDGTDGLLLHNSKDVGVFSRDLFIEQLLFKRSQFYGEAVYGRRFVPNIPCISVRIPTKTVVCDIVVPFLSTDYLRETLDSLLVQDNANCVIHAINDSEKDCSELIGEYPQIKWYQNDHNIGQFMSVNNVLNRCETDFLAINDADDISSPNRIWKSVAAMQLSDADIYGSQTTQFIQHDDLAEEYDHASFKPRTIEDLHPLVHGTMVVKKKTFIRLGGYTDFGNLDQNKCGNDTEFMVRAFKSNCRFHIGQNKLVDIRIHGSSCTNKLDNQSHARQETVNKINIRKDIFSRSFDPSFYGAGFMNSGITKLIS